MTLFFFQIYCKYVLFFPLPGTPAHPLAGSFNGAYLLEYTLILLFNLAFTSLPVAVLGIVRFLLPIFAK
jgi:hypothetical protein